MSQFCIDLSKSRAIAPLRKTCFRLLLLLNEPGGESTQEEEESVTSGMGWSSTSGGVTHKSRRPKPVA